MAGMVLGVDAGGSGTQAVLLDPAETVIRQWDLPPMNALFDNDVAARLSALILESGADAAALGLAGIRSRQQAEDLENRLAATTGIDVAVSDDAGAALAGVFLGKPGILIIAGTGSAGIGQSASGRVLRGGGAGYILGDEGGGYWIGRRVTGIALKSAAGLIPAEPEIEQLVFDAFDGGPAVVTATVYAAPTDRSLLARLVPAAVAADVPVVHQILAEAADHLVDLSRAMRRVVGDVPIVATGGLWNITQIWTRYTAATGASRMDVPGALAAARMLSAAPLNRVDSWGNAGTRPAAPAHRL